MQSIPQDDRFDSSLALLKEGYEFIPNRCKRFGSDIFQTRLMLQKAVCIQGEEAARVFYEPGRFTRRGAVPKTALWLLQDEGSVATLDDKAHALRKQMFMSMMNKASIAELTALSADAWRAAATKWSQQKEVVLFDEVQEILCRAVVAWVGVPISSEQARELTYQLAVTIDGAGAVGPRNWRGLLQRRKTESWARGVISQVRSGDIKVPEQSPVAVLSQHRDLDGNLLDIPVAVVELLNLLRPTVAVGRFIVFAALALHQHPACRQKVLEDDEYLVNFEREVRRFYPFFPAVGGRVLQPFKWRDHAFSEGDWVMLDLYGTNRDPRVWHDPDVFDPDRFRKWDGSAFNLVPQGGGDVHSNHRCAGEWLTTELIQQAVRVLVRDIEYQVPEQDFSFSLSRMPTLPNSRFLMREVKLRTTAP